MHCYPAVYLTEKKTENKKMLLSLKSQTMISFGETFFFCQSKGVKNRSRTVCSDGQIRPWLKFTLSCWDIVDKIQHFDSVIADRNLTLQPWEHEESLSNRKSGQSGICVMIHTENSFVTPFLLIRGITCTWIHAYSFNLRRYETYWFHSSLISFILNSQLHRSQIS